MTFPQFGEIIEEDTHQFKEFGEVVEDTSPKSQKISESLSFFGRKPSPESIERYRKTAGIGLKGFAKGLLGTPGEIVGVGESILKNVPEGGSKILPTTKDIGNLFDKTAGEDFTPQNTSQEFIDRGTEFLGSLMGFGGLAKASTPARALGKNLIHAFVPAGVNVLAEKSNLPPWLQAASTIGAAVLAQKFTGKSFRQLNREAHQQVRERAKDVKIDPTPAVEGIEKIKDLVRGRLRTDPTRQFIEKHANEVINRIDRGLISASEWMDINTSLNDIALEARQLPKGKALFGGIKSAVQRLDDQLKRSNPELLKEYRNANSLTKGLYETRFMENFLKKHPLLSAHAGLLSFLTKAISSPQALTGVAVAKMAQITAALVRNKGLRKAYFDVIKNASNESIKGTLPALKKFNKIAEKEGIEED